MRYFVKRYAAELKGVLSKYGFIRCGVNHLRVVNEIVQCTDLQKYLDGNSCCVYFDVKPFCLPTLEPHPSVGMGARQLGMFEGIWNGWTYDKTSEASMDNCIDEIMRFVKTYLIPIFEKAVDVKAAYNEICAFERISENIAIKRWPNRDKMEREDGVIMADYNKFLMALKFEDYDLALRHLRFRERVPLRNLKDLENEGLLTEEKRAKEEGKLEKVRKEIELVTNRDMDYITNLLNENEEKARKNFEKYIK